MSEPRMEIASQRLGLVEIDPAIRAELARRHAARLPDEREPSAAEWLARDSTRAQPIRRPRPRGAQPVAALLESAVPGLARRRHSPR